MKIIFTLLLYSFIVIILFTSCSVLVRSGFNEKVAESYRVICEDVLTNPFSLISGTRMGKYRFCYCMSEEYYNVLPSHADQNGNLPGDMVRKTFLRDQSTESYRKCSYYLSESYDRMYADDLKKNIKKKYFISDFNTSDLKSQKVSNSVRD